MSDLQKMNITFVPANQSIIHKIKSFIRLESVIKKNNKKIKYPLIYGKFDGKFKIVDRTSEEVYGVVLTKEKKESMKEKKPGQECKTMQKGKLKKLRDTLDLYKIDPKTSREFMCEDLEIYFRYKEEISKKEDSNMTYFESIRSL